MAISTDPASLSREIKDASRPPVLSEYSDFRQYLRDFYEFKKATLSTAIRPYSYAAFSASADIKSPNYLKLIIEGQRNLSMDMVGKFARAMGLSKEQAIEFKALVLYGQARDPLERNRYLKALSELRVKKQIESGEIDTEAWDKVPSWVSWALHALTDQAGMDFDPAKLRRVLRERVSAEEIRRAIELLLASGELAKDEQGKLVRGRELINGADKIPVAMVRKIQAELIYLGLESLFQDDPTEREIGALTVALTKEEFEQIKFEVRQLKKRLLKDTKVKRMTTKGERVYQLNFQLFPITNISE